MKFIKITSLFILICSFLSAPPQVYAQEPCGESYVVQQGDTLTGIAIFCDTTVEAILDANPGIDPTRLFIGQRIEIPPPEQEPAQPTVSISPACGPPGTEIQVEGRAFPAMTILEIELGEQTAPARVFVLVERLRSNANGRFSTTETIPKTASPGDSWIAVVLTRAGSPRVEVASNPFFVTSAVDRGVSTTYIVQPGDTLRSIASTFDVTIAALLSANPEITDPSLITVGQRLIIPARAAGEPAVEISPTCGPAGTELEVLVSNFPENSQVEISRGIYRSNSSIIDRDITEGQGELETTIQIPDTARRNEAWVVTVETTGSPRIRASSQIFTVSRSRNPNVVTTYIVQPDDTLISIANRFGISDQALLAANPEITNPNELTVGQRLRIPGQEQAVSIAPRVGPPGTNVRVEASNFPGNTTIEIGIGRSSTDFAVVETGRTNSNGGFTTQVTIPSVARSGERWVVVGVAQPGRFQVKATSGFFTVMTEGPAQQALVTIWPEQGPPGSTVFIVAAGFPRYTSAEVLLGISGEDFQVVDNTVTDINGTLASQITIPSGATIGQTWTVLVRTLETPSIEASSPAFMITR
jgi:LysM repeat protein